jgi:hypothetical protein
MQTTTPREIFELIGYKQPENSYRYCQARHPGLPVFEEDREVRDLLALLRPAVLVPASRKATREGWARAEATLLARLEQPASAEAPAQVVEEKRPTPWVLEGSISDSELGLRLGYSRPRKIRELVSRLVESGKISNVEAIAPKTTTKGGQPLTTYLLTPEQANIIAARANPRSTGGFVYFVAGGGLIKIGHSRTPFKRIGALITASPVPVALLTMVPGTMTDEQRLHRRLRDRRRHGEWFAISEAEALALTEEVAQ